MEKKILLAAILSIIVLFLYQQAMVRWISPPKEEATPEKLQQKVAKEDKPAVLPAQPLKSQAVFSEYQDEKTITVETPLYKAVLSSIGGGIKSFELKKYKEDMEEASKNIDMVKSLPLKLYPIHTGLADKGIIFTMPEKDAQLTASGQTIDTTLFWESPEGIRIEKRYTFSSDAYNIHMEVYIHNKSGQNIAPSLLLDIYSLHDIKEEDAWHHHGPIGFVNGNVIRRGVEDKEETAKGKIDWMGIENKFFIMAVILKEKEDAIWTSGIISSGIVRSRFDTPLNIQASGSIKKSYTIYIGPKEYKTLQGLKVNLEEAIDFGWFAFFAKPLLFALNFFYYYFKNYGLAIIILTVIIKILFHPLTRQSLNSMKEMQKLQPQVAALRERYKDDKEKMGRELMELYKRHKVNPFGGCLPMLLQIPVFIALYNVLSASIEMRHAPFFLWIQDLSAKDPYYVTPILMGATMLWQQKMTPTAMDPQQEKIMLIMPIIFTFMFLSFPSGLVLYWLINNILSIAQQYYIQRTAK